MPMKFVGTGSEYSALVFTYAHVSIRQHTAAYGSIRQHTAAYAYDIGKQWQRVERAGLDLRFAELPAAAAHEELLKDVHEVRVVKHLSSQP